MRGVPTADGTRDVHSMVEIQIQTKHETELEMTNRSLLRLFKRDETCLNLVQIHPIPSTCAGPPDPWIWGFIVFMLMC